MEYGISFLIISRALFLSKYTETVSKEFQVSVILYTLRLKKQRQKQVTTVTSWWL